MTLPQGWFEAPPKAEFAGREIRRFHPIDRPEVRFVSYVRASALSHPAQQQFEKTIYSEFHDVGVEELSALGEVVESIARSDLFTVMDAGTAYIAGKRGLRIHGSWNLSGEEVLSCFFDQASDAKQVQQVYFIAPSFDFQGFSEIANAIFLSIVWAK
jgi:hypothetical protein